MQRQQISIIYDSLHSSTAHAAASLGGALLAKGLSVDLHDTMSPDFTVLAEAQAIVFGCHTSFGTVSASFKQFMESTKVFWYQQPWKNKLAAGFTVSSSTSGDKLNTLQTLALFAAQHGMLWASTGVLPRFICGEQTEGQNRFSSFLGVMLQSCENEPQGFHTGDLLTLDLFANHIYELLNQLTIKQKQTMKNAPIENALTDLNALVANGKLMEAFEKYYSDDVAMQENANAPVVGKDANRKREKEFLDNIIEFRSASVEGVAVNENLSFVIWTYDYTHKEWGVKNYTQVSVQHWRDGLIYKEQFFYGS